MSLLTRVSHVKIDFLGSVDRAFDLPVLTDLISYSEFHLSANVAIVAALFVFRKDSGGLFHIDKLSD